MQIDPDNDPNEAYEVQPFPERPHGPRDYWQVSCNGIVVGVAPNRDEAERYAKEPAYRLEREAAQIASKRVGGLVR